MLPNLALDTLTSDSQMLRKQSAPPGFPAPLQLVKNKKGGASSIEVDHCRPAAQISTSFET